MIALHRRRQLRQVRPDRDRNETGDEKFEFIQEVDGTPRNEAADSTANVAANFPKDYYLRIVSDGTNITGAYSTDGHDLDAGRPRRRRCPAGREDRHVRVQQRRGGLAGRRLRLVPPRGRGRPGGGGTPSGPSRDDDFSGTSLDKTRWNAIVRENPAKYAVGGGNLTITTELGDIYTGDTNPPPPNFILQSADHAGEDWTIETKLSATITRRLRPGRPDRLRERRQLRQVRRDLRRRQHADQPPRAALGGRRRDPEPDAGRPGRARGHDQHLAAPEEGRHDLLGRVLVRRHDVDAGGVHDAERDGGPAFGLFAVRAAGRGRRRRSVVRLLHARRAGPARRGCDCTGPGDEFDGDRRSTPTKCNAIVRPGRHRRSTFEDGKLKVTTVLGDIYTNSDPSGTRNFLLQSADHSQGGLRPRDQGRRHPAQRRLRPGRHPGPHRRRQLREVRRDLRRRQPEVQPDRAALGAGRRDPEPAAGGDDRASRPSSTTSGCG